MTSLVRRSPVILKAAHEHLPTIHTHTHMHVYIIQATRSSYNMVFPSVSELVILEECSDFIAAFFSLYDL